MRSKVWRRSSEETSAPSSHFRPSFSVKDQVLPPSFMVPAVGRGVADQGGVALGVQLVAGQTTHDRHGDGGLGRDVDLRRVHVVHVELLERVDRPALDRARHLGGRTGGVGLGADRDLDGLGPGDLGGLVLRGAPSLPLLHALSTDVDAAATPVAMRKFLREKDMLPALKWK